MANKRQIIGPLDTMNKNQYSQVLVLRNGGLGKCMVLKIILAERFQDIKKSLHCELTPYMAIEGSETSAVRKKA